MYEPVCCALHMEEAAKGTPLGFCSAQHIQPDAAALPHPTPLSL